MRHLSVCGLVALSLLCGCRHDISGTYLASDRTGVLWLQLVRTPDDHLTGQLSLSKLNTEGKVDFDAVSVTGVYGDGNVTLSGSRFFGLQTFALSGTLDGNKLTLSGSGGPTPFVLSRADMSEYLKQLANLNATSQSFLAAKAAAVSRQRMDQAQRNLVARIDQAVSRMQRFDSEADAHLGRFPVAEKQYQAITAKIGGYVQRERSLAGNSDAEVTRSQLSVAATQASFETDQMHYQTQSLESSLSDNIKPLSDEAANLEAACGAPGATLPTLTPTQADAHNAACGRLATALPTFRQKYSAITAGLAHLERVYSEEKSAQQALLQTAEKLQ